MRELREAVGLSQTELGQAARLSRQSISAIESGRSMPAVDVALRLASALEATVEQLFGAAAEGTRASTRPR
ncbi:MAG: helix-turn-helix domain-containing protein [Polyangiaceae bacterium]